VDAMNRIFLSAALVALMVMSACGPQEADETVDDTVGVAREALYSDVPAKLLAAPGGNRVDLELYGSRLYFPIAQDVFRLSTSGGTPVEVFNDCISPAFISDLVTDGSYIAYVCKGGITYSNAVRLRIWDIAAGWHTTLLNDYFGQRWVKAMGCQGLYDTPEYWKLPSDLSMDSTYVYYQDAQYIWRVPRNGSTAPVKLTTTAMDISQMVRSGSTIFFTTNMGVYRVSTSGTGLQALYFSTATWPGLEHLTVINGYVYFSEWNNVLKRVPTAGGTIQTVLAADTTRYIKSLTAVPVANAITVAYIDAPMCGSGDARVRKLPAGGTPTTIESLPRDQYPVNLRADTSYVYWWDAAGIKRDLLNSDPVIFQ
jgi:hypothetical protein